MVRIEVGLAFGQTLSELARQGMVGSQAQYGVVVAATALFVGQRTAVESTELEVEVRALGPVSHHPLEGFRSFAVALARGEGEAETEARLPIGVIAFESLPISR